MHKIVKMRQRKLCKITDFWARYDRGSGGKSGKIQKYGGTWLEKRPEESEMSAL
ncbi:hypothetical protein CLOSTASPAR_05082 [[Clostridium] asparagiforme DSM 15981]|uniref:Uncharacterized protein n=1 Tax=[Clostridium] asparagiforme DSM 15981 TaxID=518636 RepID=C0D735_9FIRM|nr:hypothetical protein CLOSTASPAR_05082 [[Clostridium] asparagiforme DSM 15981]